MSTVHRPSKATARALLEQSSLTARAINQTQGLGDVDIDSLVLQIKGATGLSIIDQIQDALIHRTIDGASTIEVQLHDPDRRVLTSGKIARTTDINLDGLWFRLVQAGKEGDQLTLTFEDRIVSVLRTYKSKLGPFSRTKITRAEFVLRMLAQVREFDIPYWIPELHDVQPIETDTQASEQFQTPTKTQGIPSNAGGPSPVDSRRFDQAVGLTVKNSPMTPLQIRVANKVLGAGTSMDAPRKVLVCSMMCAIQESTMANLQGGDLDSVGVFQQRKSQGWPATRDITIDARAFFSKAIGYHRQYPNLGYGELVQMVQHSKYPNAYDRWRTEAERIVNAYVGKTPATSDASGSVNLFGGSDYFYYRGVPPRGSGPWKPEDSWTCIQRLAQEVGWRAFTLGGEFYYVTETYLFKSQPVVKISPDSPGIQDINFDFDAGKKTATVEIECFMKRWAAPPGTVIELQDMGPIDGRWLVSDVERSAFDEVGTITLTKPTPALPEPLTSDLQQDQVFTTDPSDTQQGGQPFKTGTSLVNPIAPGYGSNGSHGAFHETAGLSGYRALDFFAKPDTPVLAPESGRITRFSGHQPSLGPIADNGLPGGAAAAGGPLGWSVYLQGDSGSIYYITHLGTRSTYVGASVAAGEKIGTVANYDRWGRRSHVHVGIKPSSTGPDIESLGEAPQAVKR